MNDQLVLEWARALAGRVLNDGGLSPDQQVDRAFRLAFRALPNADERTAVFGFPAPADSLDRASGWRATKNSRAGSLAGRNGPRRAPRPSWTFARCC